MQVDEKVLSRTIERFRERKVLLPTFAQMRDPSTVPEKIKQRLKNVGLWDVDPVNLFRITWKNEPVERGGLYNKGNWIEFPSALTGVDARIIGLVGKFFPDRRSQSRRGVWLPGAEAGERAVRSDAAQSGLAQHRQLLPRRSVRFGARGLHGRRDSAGGNEPRAVRVAQGNRRRGDSDAGLRIECERDLRQVLGNSQDAT